MHRSRPPVPSSREPHSFSMEGPGVPVMNVSMGKDARCYRPSIQLSSRKRPLRHLVAVLEEFGPTAISESKGRTLLADSEASFIWASMAQTFGLPCVPEWELILFEARRQPRHCAVAGIRSSSCADYGH